MYFCFQKLKFIIIEKTAFIFDAAIARSTYDMKTFYDYFPFNSKLLHTISLGQKHSREVIEAVSN